MSQFINQLKSLIHPNIWDRVSYQFTESDKPGTLTQENEHYYGQYNFRIVAILDVGNPQFKDYIDDNHPVEWTGLYSIKMIKIDNIEAFMIVGMCLESDNKNYSSVGTEFHKQMSRYNNKRSYKLPVAVSSKRYAQWVEASRDVALMIYEE